MNKDNKGNPKIPATIPTNPKPSITEKIAAGLVKRPQYWEHKGDFGHGLLIAGSYGMAGACIMAAQAALRSGIGKLSILSPNCNRQIIQTAVPQAMYSMNPTTTSNYYWNTKINNINSYEAVAVGPGLNTHQETLIALKELLINVSEHSKPLIIDADALNIISQQTSLLKLIPKNSILTPHYGELQRLVGKCPTYTDALHKATDLALKISSVIILKGWHSTIINTNGEIIYNSTGNSGMGTGGSGDVLIGILLSLRAYGYSAWDAARLGTFLHGRAGDISAKSLTSISMNALDIINYLPNAWKSIISHTKTPDL